jgi:quinol monooxygenase YgiN
VVRELSAAVKAAIIVAGTVDVDPEQREAALLAGEPHMQKTRAQDGCLDYSWSADGLTPGRIYVYERWASEAALAAHFSGPHYRAMRDTIAAHGLRGAHVLKYAIARAEPVYDRSGTPRADFFADDSGES